MNTKIAGAGSIFILRDQTCINSEGKYKKHPYLVIGSGQAKNNLSMIQCVGITSLKNRPRNMEIPILLSNDNISYVVPYNIYSYNERSLSTNYYKGCLCNGDILSLTDFIKLIMDIHALYIDCGLVDYDSVKERYDDYCNRFYKAHNIYTDTENINPEINTVIPIKISNHNTNSDMQKEIIVPKEKPIEQTDYTPHFTTIRPDGIKSIPYSDMCKDKVSHRTIFKPLEEWTDKALLVYMYVCARHGAEIVVKHMPVECSVANCKKIFTNGYRECVKRNIQLDVGCINALNLRTLVDADCLRLFYTFINTPTNDILYKLNYKNTGNVYCRKHSLIKELSRRGLSYKSSTVPVHKSEVLV